MTIVYFLLSAAIAVPSVEAEPVAAPPPPLPASTPPPAGTPAPVPGKAYPRPPIPLGNPGTWATSDDYPSVALRNDVEGVTAFELSVDKTGKVVGCEVKESSGAAILDTTTCALITERARFTPALDANGKPTAGTYPNRVRWQIPDLRDLPEAAVLVVSLVVETDGRVTNCRVERQEGAAVRLGDRASQVCPRQFKEPFHDGEGNPVRKIVRFTQSIAIRDLPAEADKPAN